MTSAVCTLFEGSYHYGVAALSNSLFASGFRGVIYAGYRGSLPAWAAAAKPTALPPWTGATVLSAAEGLKLVFVPLTTDFHLTNYKPHFMLALMDGPARSAEAMFYLDPDICVVDKWQYFEDWVSSGVALCEDVNSPLPQFHPRRVGWRRYYARHGLELRFRGSEYVNGGFVGVRAEDRGFLATWKLAMELMAHEIGSLAVASIAAGQAYRSTGFAGCFDRTDQDALNAAIELSDLSASIIGQEAMAFKPGAALLPHALGSGKPWQRNYLRMALSGTPPRVADKAFWANVNGPIDAFQSSRAAFKKLDITAAAAVGRLLRRA